jgi:hypothetical protein
MVSTADQGVLSINSVAVARLQKLTISQEPSAVHEPNGLGYAYPFAVEPDAFKAGMIEAEKMIIGKEFADYLHSGTTLATVLLTITKEDGTTFTVTLTDAQIISQKTSGTVNEIIMETVTIMATQLVWA